MSESTSYSWNELLGRLVGYQLISVQFTMDYLTLQFQRDDVDAQPALTCEVMPHIATGGRDLSDGDVGFADALRALVTQRVVRTSERPNDGLTLEMQSASIRFRPTAAELTGPEVAMLNGFADRSWMCWRPGEEAFEYL